MGGATHSGGPTPRAYAAGPLGRAYSGGPTRRAYTGGKTDVTQIALLPPRVTVHLIPTSSLLSLIPPCPHKIRLVETGHHAPRDRSGVVGLRSAVDRGFAGGIVELWAYASPENLPEGVRFRDASALLLEEEFQRCLKAGVAVQQLADYVRTLALCAGGGFFVDVDQLWFKRADALICMAPPAFGHAFGSTEACSFLPGKSKAQQTTHWQLHGLCRPGDVRHLSVPFCFPAGSPMLQAWRDFMRAELDATAHSSRAMKAASKKLEYNKFWAEVCSRVG